MFPNDGHAAAGRVLVECMAILSETSLYLTQAEQDNVWPG